MTRKHFDKSTLIVTVYGNETLQRRVASVIEYSIQYMGLPAEAEVQISSGEYIKRLGSGEEIAACQGQDMKANGQKANGQGKFESDTVVVGGNSLEVEDAGVTSNTEGWPSGRWH